MTAPARSMRFVAPDRAPMPIGVIARQFTAAVLVAVVIALYVAAMIAIGSFIWHDVPRIAGGALYVLTQGNYGPTW